MLLSLGLWEWKEIQQSWPKSVCAVAAKEQKEKVMEEVNAEPTTNAVHWYIAYTLPRHEKAIAQRLKAEEIPCYVPLYSERRTWGQRKVELELPLLPCYVFVKMPFDAELQLWSGVL